MKTKVYLVGAGIGNSSLITMRGLELIRSCDVLIYDRLAGSDILSYCKPDCKKIYVGKSVGKHYKRQEEINDILVSEAKSGNRVVRLKGGDPFVFGRGGEEAIALVENNIDYELVPGVTSAIAGPELAGIPVTHRLTSRSLHIYTGHTAVTGDTEDISGIDLKTAARAEGTLVFLMGVGNIELISNRLMEYGKDKNTPVAFIENASLDTQRVLKATLKDAKSCVDSNCVKSPCVIVIGECANFNMLCQSTSVAVTGTDSFCNKLTQGLWGYEVKRRCKMATTAVLSDKLRDCLNNIDEYEWLILTSSNGVEYFISALETYKVDIRKLCNLKFAVIGKGTYDTLAKKGIFADFVPSIYSTECLGMELSKQVKGKVLMLRADNSRAMEGFFKASEDVAIYSLKAEYMTECNEDYIVFGSSGCARQYMESIKISDSTTIIAIGEATAATIRRKGYDCVMADEYTVDGIINKIEAIENAKNA